MGLSCGPFRQWVIMTKGCETDVLDSYRVVVLYSGRPSTRLGTQKSATPGEGLEY